MPHSTSEETPVDSVPTQIEFQITRDHFEKAQEWANSHIARHTTSNTRWSAHCAVALALSDAKPDLADWSVGFYNAYSSVVTQRQSTKYSTWKLDKVAQKALTIADVMAIDDYDSSLTLDQVLAVHGFTLPVTATIFKEGE